MTESADHEIVYAPPADEIWMPHDENGQIGAAWCIEDVYSPYIPCTHYVRMSPDVWRDKITAVVEHEMRFFDNHGKQAARCILQKLGAKLFNDETWLKSSEGS